MATETTHPVGKRVLVAEFGETPLEAIERHTSLVDMPPPDPATLSARDVIVAIEVHPSDGSIS